MLVKHTFKKKIIDAGVGPTNWNKGFPSCGGSKQSPINIEGRSAEFVTFDPFVFTGYDTASPDNYFSVVNNGHTGLYTGMILIKTIIKL